jgi:flagellar biosynthesis protein FlhF
MHTHTFIAESANEAVQQIREELGPSAVVLSVRRLPRSGLSRLSGKEKIEVIASVENPASPSDPADSLGDLQTEIRELKQQFAALRLAQRSRRLEEPELRDLPQLPASHLGGYQSLLAESGILPAFCERILGEIPPTHLAAGMPAVEKALRAKWRGEPVQSEAAVHLFIGVPGSGKTTVLCKMLAQTSLVERQPATVFQLDAHVANSAVQPALFAEIVGAHFERTLPANFERREESVFVDVPGVAVGDEKGLAALRLIIEAFGVPEIHLVLNGAYESAHLLEQVRFFAKLGMSDLIVSHLDEESRWGKVWNLVLGTNFKVRYLSSGQNIPGNLIGAAPDVILDRQFRRN